MVEPCGMVFVNRQFAWRNSSAVMRYRAAMLSRVSPGLTVVAVQLFGIWQEGGGGGVFVEMAVFVGVGDMSGGGRVAVAVRGRGDGSTISVDVGGAGLANSTSDKESPPSTSIVEIRASNKAFPNWRAEAIISSLWASLRFLPRSRSKLAAGH